MAQYNQQRPHFEVKKKPDEFVSAIDQFLAFASKNRKPVTAVFIILLLGGLSFMYFQTAKEAKLNAIAQSLYEASKSKEPDALQKAVSQYSPQSALVGAYVELTTQAFAKGDVEGALMHLEPAIAQSRGLFKSILLLQKAQYLKAASKNSEALSLVKALKADPAAKGLQEAIALVESNLETK